MAGFLFLDQIGEHLRQSYWTRELCCYTQIALFLMEELVAALRANDPDSCRCWLTGGVQDLGKPVAEELLLAWLAPFLAVED